MNSSKNDELPSKKQISDNITLTLNCLDGQVHIIQVLNSARMHDVADTLRKLCTDLSGKFIRFHRAGKENQLPLNKRLVKLGIGNGDTLYALIAIHNPALDKPLRKAISNGDISQVGNLLDNWADVNAVNINKWTPIHYASLKGDEAIATLLLENGADVNALNISKWTPLRLACVAGHDAVVQLLLDNGADMNVVDHL